MTMSFERRTVGTYDLRISRVQRGGRPTLLLTNAFPQSIRCWESLWDRLAERFDLVAVDLPGFGLSEGSEEVMRPSAQAEVLVALLDDLGIERAFVVGPDVGVPVALTMASRHPERVLGVNVYDGPGTWPTDFDPALDWAVRSPVVRWFGLRPPMRGVLMRLNVRAATGDGYHHFEPSEAAVEEYRSIAFDRDKHRWSIAYLGSYAEELPEIEAALPGIEVPVLVTWGGHDGFVRTSNAERIHALVPGSELTVFEDAGHFSHEDADGAWLERVAAFVEARAA